jgi:hypothetical protein
MKDHHGGAGDDADLADSAPVAETPDRPVR